MITLPARPSRILSVNDESRDVDLNRKFLSLARFSWALGCKDWCQRLPDGFLWVPWEDSSKWCIDTWAHLQQLVQYFCRLLVLMGVVGTTKDLNELASLGVLGLWKGVPFGYRQNWVERGSSPVWVEVFRGTAHPCCLPRKKGNFLQFLPTSSFSTLVISVLKGLFSRVTLRLAGPFSYVLSSKGFLHVHMLNFGLASSVMYSVPFIRLIFCFGFS